MVGGGKFLLLPSCPWGREGPTGGVFMSACLQANQPKSREEERGCDLADPQLLWNIWCTFQFNIALPRSPHACLRARLTGDTVLLDKSSCSTRHTQQLFSVATYHLMTLMEGKATHRTATLHQWGETIPAAHYKITLSKIQTPTEAKQAANSNVHVQRRQ